MQTIVRINKVIDNFNLLKHPLYQAWSNGELSKDILQKYAMQYYHQVSSFPRFISRVHTHCPEIEVRKMLLDNLADEEIRGKDHPSLWMSFANGMGVTKEAVLNESAIPETQFMVDTFYKLADRDWRDGLCALYAYENQVPEVSISKIDGLMKFYNIHDHQTLEFFILHQKYDVEHSQQVAKIIQQYVDPARAEQASQEAAYALWNFLNGICRISNIECQEKIHRN